MRWFIGSVIAVALAWAVYVVSPYWALRNLALAVEAGRVEEVAGRVNFRALRHSLARHLMSDLTAAERTATLSRPDAQMAAGAIAAAADPLFERILTAQGVVDLLRPSPMPGSGSDGARRPFARGTRSFDRLVEFLSASAWRGFRNVYFTLPPDAPRESRFRLQMRLSRLTWRLVSVELPPDTRRRLALQVLGRPPPR